MKSSNLFRMGMLAVLLGIIEVPSAAADLTISTLAGSTSIGYQNGEGHDALFHDPKGIVRDSSGNLFLTDSENLVVRKLTPSGTNWTVSTFAGTPGTTRSRDGIGEEAWFARLVGLTIDDEDNLYVVDRDLVRKVTPGGVVTTLIDDLQLSMGIAVQGGTNIFITRNDHRIIKYYLAEGQWIREPIAGAQSLPGKQDGTGEEARFNSPHGIAVDENGILYVADLYNFSIRKITPEGTNWVVTTLAGSGGFGGGTGDTFGSPTDVDLDEAGNVYVADDFGIKRISPEGLVTNLAGKPNTFDSADGLNEEARFKLPYGIFADSTTNLFVTGIGNQTVRMVVPQGLDWATTTIAGLKPNPEKDGLGTEARLQRPWDVVADNQGNLFVADTGNYTIRKIDSFGQVTTIAGKTGMGGYEDGVGTEARLVDVFSMDMDEEGTLFITAGNRIRKLAPDGTNWVVTTLAGDIQGGYEDGIGPDAKFSYPHGIVVDKTGRLFVSDRYNHVIRMLTPEGTNWMVTTIAGTPKTSGHADGTNEGARFNGPAGLVMDADGRLFVADDNNDSIRLITPNEGEWIVTTPVGQPERSGGYADGINNEARFHSPADVALDEDGNLYVIETQNSLVRKITIDGDTWNVETLAGESRKQGSSDGTGPEASFRFPNGIDVDANGTIYIADTSNDTIRTSGTLPNPPTTAPVLEINRAEEGLIVSWEGSGLELQTSSDLTVGWADTAEPPLQTGDVFSVTIQLLGEVQFFRLVGSR